MRVRGGGGVKNKIFDYIVVEQPLSLQLRWLVFFGHLPTNIPPTFRLSGLIKSSHKLVLSALLVCPVNPNISLSEFRFLPGPGGFDLHFELKFLVGPV